MNRLLTLGVLIILLAGCDRNNTQTSFIKLSDMDTTVRPQDDFFQYVNGAWLDSTAIPESESRWGSFSILNDNLVSNLNSLLQEIADGKKHKKGSAEQLIADLFRSGMDSTFIEELGITPLTDELATIDSIRSADEILPNICRQMKSGLVPLRYGIVPSHVITFYVYQDQKNSERQLAHLEQGSLGLPTNEYYLKTDSSSVALRNKYVNYIASLLELSGTDSVSALNQAASILKLETSLAAASRTPVELRDPILNYNKFSIEQLDSLAPEIAWLTLIADLGISTDTLNMGQPDYFNAFAELLFSEPLDTWKSMMRYRIIRSNAGLLSHAFVKVNFDFYGQTLRGTKEMKPRWKRMSRTIDAALGDALGQLYVERYFPPEAKQRMDELVNNLLSAYEERIKMTCWMSDTTKLIALDKLHAITRKIGYPNKWDNYEGVEIEHDDYVGNIRNTRKYAYGEMIAKLDQPVDKESWLMTPPTVNAYYSSSNNEIVFPAGILQPPFFNYHADDAINYGAIGVVIGHEVTHGFDDKGRKFDAHGNLNEWWTNEDIARFDKQAAAIVEQFNAYEVLDGLFVNGELTQGENIADLGGLVISYDAFKKTQQGQSDELIDGFTPDQRFFLSYAKVWMQKSTDEVIRQQVLGDPHSPEKLRVNGPLQNLKAFHNAFHVQPGDALYRPDSLLVTIW